MKQRTLVITRLSLDYLSMLSDSYSQQSSHASIWIP